MSKIEYYPEQDLLYYNQGESSQDSLDIAGITIDFGFEDDVVGFEIDNASRVLSDFIQEDIGEDFLKSITDSEIIVRRRGEQALIVILLYSQESEDKERINLTVPDTTLRTAVA